MHQKSCGWIAQQTPHTSPPYFRTDQSGKKPTKTEISVLLNVDQTTSPVYAAQGEQHGHFQQQNRAPVGAILAPHRGPLYPEPASRVLHVDPTPLLDREELRFLLEMELETTG